MRSQQVKLSDYDVDRSPYGNKKFFMTIRLVNNYENGDVEDNVRREFQLDRGFASQTPDLDEKSFRGRNDITNEALDKFAKEAVSLMIGHQDDAAEYEIAGIDVEEREKIREVGNIDIEDI